MTASLGRCCSFWLFGNEKNGTPLLSQMGGPYLPTNTNPPSFWLMLSGLAICLDTSRRKTPSLEENAASSRNDKYRNAKDNVQDNVGLFLVRVQSSRSLTHQTIAHGIRYPNLWGWFNLYNSNKKWANCFSNPNHVQMRTEQATLYKT